MKQRISSNMSDSCAMKIVLVCYVAGGRERLMRLVGFVYCIFRAEKKSLEAYTTSSHGNS